MNARDLLAGLETAADALVYRARAAESASILFEPDEWQREVADNDLAETRRIFSRLALRVVAL